MAWSAITDAEIDPESPATTGLMGKYRDNQEAWHNGNIYARKAAPTIRNLAGISDDPHLTVTPVANSIYMVKLVLFITTANAAADIRFQFTTPAGSTAVIGYLAPNQNPGAARCIFSAITAAPSTMNYDVAQTGVVMLFEGTLRTAAAATAFALAWDSAGAGNTTLLADSYMVLQQPSSDM